MEETYWTRTLNRRISRRRALAGAASVGMGSVLLAACGGDDGDSGGTSSLVAPYELTTDKAVKGGVWQNRMTREPEHYDPQSGTFAPLTHAVHAYSRLLGFKTGTVFDLPDGSVEADAATSWEVAPDSLKVTLKLRQNMKLDPRPPTNGRPITAADVKYSFDRFAALSPNRGNILNSVSTDLPVTNLTTPDDNTVVVDLAFPDSSILSMLAWSYFLNVVPTEAEGQFDIKQDMRGSGPWMMTKYTPSVGWEYRRNPNWYRAGDRPFLDGIDYAFLTETTAAEAQFKAKKLWNYTPPANLVTTIARELPDAKLHGTSPLVGNGSARVMNLSKLPTSPLRDKRVRQAVALLIDRDLMIDVFGNVSGFETEGIPVETAWHSHTPASWPGIWLNPKENELGPSSKYFHHDPEESARLLRAAGQYGGELEFGIWTDAQLPQQAETMEVVTDMLQAEGHFKLNRLFGEYRTWYVPRYSTNPGSFEGIASYQVIPSFPDWNMVMWGMAPGARNDFIFDWNLVPGLREIMIKHRDERDQAKRISIAHDWQKLLADEMPFIPYSMPGGASSFEFNWPWLANYGVIQPWGTYAIAYDTYVDYWYDQAKQS